jgi:hypothetical protein
MCNCENTLKCQIQLTLAKESTNIELKSKGKQNLLETKDLCVINTKV